MSARRKGIAPVKPTTGAQVQAAQKLVDEVLKMPARRLGASYTRDIWWGLFCDLIMAAVDGGDALQSHAAFNRELIGNARTIADAAVDEFEKRWVE